MVKCEGDELTGEPMEMVASHGSGPKEMDAYERVLHDAMVGDATLFAREDYVEEAWRIVDPAIKAGTPLYEYDAGTWGPVEAEETIVPRDGWHNPVIAATQTIGAGAHAA
jgi:glucose-6-phosphate 1-dehydrogenase